MTQQDLEKLPYRENVGIMLVNYQNMVFVGQRLDNHQDAWQMPQGGIDPGENAEDAAFRELKEETGVIKDFAQIEAGYFEEEFGRITGIERETKKKKNNRPRTGLSRLKAGNPEN